MATYKIRLNVRKGASSVPPQVVVRAGDAETQVIMASVYDDGQAFSPAWATSARLELLHADRTWARVGAEIGDGTLTCVLPNEAVSSPGTCRLAYFAYLGDNGERESTGGLLLRILPRQDASGEAARSYSDELDALYEKWAAYEEAAEKQEAARVSAESTRVSNENARVSNEKTRVSQETARVAAEKARAAEYTGIVNTCNTATSAAQGAAATANAAANTALEIANTAAQNSAGDSDIAALKNDVTVLGSKVADLLGEFYYLDGVIYCPSSKVTYSGTGITLASTCSYSGTTIALA